MNLRLLFTPLLFAGIFAYCASPGLRADTTTITAEADAQVRSGSYTGTNYGAQNGMAVSQTSATNAYESFIRFNMGAGINGTITDAKVKVYHSNSSATAAVHTAYSVTDDSWGEMTITWSNKPAGTTSLGSWTPTAAGYREFNVTSLIQAENTSGNKLFSVRLAAAAIDATIINYTTRENITASLRPQLIITYTPAPAETTVDLPVSIDAHVRSASSYAGANYGTAVNLTVAENTTTDNFIGYLRFNMDNLPGNTISSAILKLRCNTTSTIPHRLYLVTNDVWNETKVSYYSNGSNGNEPRPDYNNASTTPIAEWTPAPGTIHVDITSTVHAQNLAAGRMISLRIQASATGAPLVTYCAKENTNASYRPVLTVTYSGTTPTPPTLTSNEEIENALYTAKPGNTFNIADGIYSNLSTEMATDGTSSNPITIRALNAGQAKFTDDTYIGIKGDYCTVSGMVFDKCTKGTVVNFDGASYCRLTECAFFNCGEVGNDATHLVENTNGAHHNMFDHLYMTKNYGMGIAFRVHPWNQGNTDSTIERVWFHDIDESAPNANGREGVQCGQGGPYYEPNTNPPNSVLWDGVNPPMDNLTRITIQYNLFDDYRADREMISLKSGANIVRYNTVRDCTDETITVRGGVGNRVEGNFIFNSRGIRVFGPDHVVINNYVDGTNEGIWLGGGGGGYSPATNILLAHNTVINGWQKGLYLGENWATGGAGPSGRIYNNIIHVATNKEPIKLWSSSIDLSGLTWSNNIGWRSGGSYAWGYIDNLTTGQCNKIDPLLSTTLISGMKRFGTTSPGYGTGTNLSTEVPQDADGQSRATTPDIGCDEVPASGVGTITRAPLTNLDVGPVWMAGNPGSVVRVP